MEFRFGIYVPYPAFEEMPIQCRLIEINRKKEKTMQINYLLNQAVCSS